MTDGAVPISSGAAFFARAYFFRGAATSFIISRIRERRRRRRERYGTNGFCSQACNGGDCSTVLNELRAEVTALKASNLYEFGGAWGYSSGDVTNPICALDGVTCDASNHCPDGFTSLEIAGTGCQDYPAGVCWRLRDQSSTAP